MEKWYEYDVYQYRLLSERNEAEEMLNASFVAILANGFQRNHGPNVIATLTRA